APYDVYMKDTRPSPQTTPPPPRPHPLPHTITAQLFPSHHRLGSLSDCTHQNCQTHQHAHTHTHARTHARTHAHTHTHTHTHTHMLLFLWLSSSLCPPQVEMSPAPIQTRASAHLLNRQ